MVVTVATDPSVAALVVETLKSGPFIGVALLVAVALLCIVGLVSGGHTVEFVDGRGDDLELSEARQQELHRLAVRDIYAPIIPVESDPTRSRASLHVLSNPEREQRVRQAQRRSFVRRGGVDPWLSKQGA